MGEKMFSKRWKIQMGTKVGVIFLVSFLADKLIYGTEEVYIIPFLVLGWSTTLMFLEIRDNNMGNQDVGVFWILNKSNEKLSEVEKLRIDNNLRNKSRSILNLNLIFLGLTIVILREAAVFPIIGMVIADKNTFMGTDRLFKTYTKITGTCNGIARKGRRNLPDIYYVSVVDYINKKEVILVCEESDLYSLRMGRESTFIYGKLSKELLYLY